MNTSEDTQDFAVGSSLVITYLQNGFLVTQRNKDGVGEKRWGFNSVQALGDGVAKIAGGSSTEKKCSCQKPFAAPTVGELAKDYRLTCSACGIVTHILTDLVPPASGLLGQPGRFCSSCEVQRRNAGWYTPSNYIDKQLVKDVETYEVPL